MTDGLSEVSSRSLSLAGRVFLPRARQGSVGKEQAPLLVPHLSKPSLHSLAGFSARVTSQSQWPLLLFMSLASEAFQGLLSEVGTAVFPNLEQWT